MAHRAAQQAFDAQYLLAALTTTLPVSPVTRSVAAVPALRKALAGGRPLSVHLQHTLAACGVPPLSARGSLHPPPPKDETPSSTGRLEAQKEEEEEEDGAANQATGAAPLPVVVFLLDIEGTTTPLPFVRRVMFPTVVDTVREYLDTHYPDDAEVHLAVRQAATATASSGEPELSTALESDEAHEFTEPAETNRVRDLFAACIQSATSGGSTEPWVKQIQGKVWAYACERNAARSDFFHDVDTFIRTVGSTASKEGGSHVAIYSTGSVLAQRVLLTHTAQGDLTPYISAFFDPTMVGSKLQPESYQAIRRHLCQQTGVPEEADLRLVFFTDNPKEAAAAKASGAVDCPVLCIRPLNAWVSFSTLKQLDTPYMCTFQQVLDPNAAVDFFALVREVRRYR